MRVLLKTNELRSELNNLYMDQLRVFDNNTTAFDAFDDTLMQTTSDDSYLKSNGYEDFNNNNINNMSKRNNSEDENWDENEVTFPPKPNDILNNYELEKCVKWDRYCVVFICHPITDTKLKYIAKIGIKREEIKLRKERDNYLLLKGGEGIPELISHHWWTGKSLFPPEEWSSGTRWGMIVIEKLCARFSFSSKGEAILNQMLDLEKLVPIALQQISALEYLHSKGLLHRGVKPDNFVFSADGKKVFIIDFNRSKSYLKSNKEHVEYQFGRNKPPTGNCLFHSKNYHNGVRRSRRDDMESLGLCWVYQLKGRLPWSLSEETRNTMSYEDYYKHFKTQVNKTSIEDLCEGLPLNFVLYFKMCREMGFQEKPNYEEMRCLIRSSIIQNFNDLNHSDDSGISC